MDFIISNNQDIVQGFSKDDDSLLVASRLLHGDDFGPLQESLKEGPFEVAKAIDSMASAIDVGKLLTFLSQHPNVQEQFEAWTQQNTPKRVTFSAQGPSAEKTVFTEVNQFDDDDDDDDEECWYEDEDEDDEDDY